MMFPFVVLMTLAALTLPSTLYASGPSALTITMDSGGLYYDPVTAVATDGTTITWRNGTPSPHNIRHDGCGRRDSECWFDSGIVRPDAAFSIAAPPPGRYPYHCELHPIMRGILIVGAADLSQRAACGEGCAGQ